MNNTVLKNELIKQKAKKNRELPMLNTIKPVINEEIIKVISEPTNLAFVLSDVLYLQLFDLCTIMQTSGHDLRGQLKKDFNDFFNTIQKAKKQACLLGRTLGVLIYEEQEKFTNESEYLIEVIRLLHNRLQGSADADIRIKSIISNFPEAK